MNVQAMTPAGWLTGRDVVYRVAEAMHGLVGATDARQLDPAAAAGAAVALLGSALCMPRPPIGAFVRQGGEWFPVPPRLWAGVVDRSNDDDGLSLSQALLMPCLPEFFDEYAGQVALYGVENVVDFVSRVEPPAPPPAFRDPARPWRDFNSVSAWLSSDKSTQFIDERLALAGNTAPRPIDRNRALHAYLEAHGESISFEALQSRRRPSRMTD